MLINAGPPFKGEAKNVNKCWSPFEGEEKMLINAGPPFEGEANCYISYALRFSNAS